MTNDDNVEMDLTVIHKINLTNRGFIPSWVDMKVNESISIWIDTKLDYNRIFFVGVQRCGEEIESGLLDRGDTFNWTFSKHGTCHIIEARSESKVLKLNIE